MSMQEENVYRIPYQWYISICMVYMFWYQCYYVHSSLLLCYVFNFINDITQYGTCYTLLINVYEFEFEYLFQFNLH